MPESTVTVRLLGGLGNQMFQYAAALSLAKKKNASVLIDLGAFEAYKLWPYLLHQLNVPQDIASVPVRAACGSSFICKVIRKLTGGGPKRGNVYTEPHFHYDPAFFDLDVPIALEGYFQSPLYFQDIRDELLNRFTLKEPMSAISAEYASKIANTKTPVSLHVRRGDYVSNQAALATHGVAAVDYYRQAVDVLNGLYGPDTTYFIFSDDPDYVEENFGFCTNRVIVRGASDRPYEDMRLMSMCRHNIIANSSFSWWGAWLNPHADKKVIAPRQWFTREKMMINNTMDIYPQGWILI